MFRPRWTSSVTRKSWLRFVGDAGTFFGTNPATSRHKPKLAVTFSKELQAVDGLDVSNDSEEMHPPSVSMLYFKA